MKKGDRVFAIMSSDNTEVKLFGFGVYDGEEPFGGRETPRIKLDNGGTVYGYQCWWGPENEFKNTFANHTITMVEPPARINEKDMAMGALSEMVRIFGPQLVADAVKELLDMLKKQEAEQSKATEQIIGELN